MPLHTPTFPFDLNVYLWLTGTKANWVLSIWLWNGSASPIDILWSQIHYALFIALSNMHTCISKTRVLLDSFKRSTVVCFPIGYPLIFLRNEGNNISGVHFVYLQIILTIYVKGNFTFSLSHYYLPKHNYMSIEWLRTSSARAINHKCNG